MDNKVLRFENPNSRHSLVLEDDGKTGYAYLLDEESKIVADCWLYNRGAAPHENEWNTLENMPFANSIMYVKPEFADGFGSIHNEDELTLEWTESGVDIILKGQLFARVVTGGKPGWSRLAAKDGPLALVLTD